MDPIIVNALTTPYPRTAASSRPYRPAFTVIVILGILLGATLVVAAVERLPIGDATAGVAVTDGWAHSPITRLGSAAGSAGVAVTDGWAHSPITREGGSDVRDAMLRQLAASYQQQDPAAEARSR